MRILIAGGAGYIGSRLIPYLEGEGHEVKVIDLLWFGNSLPASIPVTQKDVNDLSTEDVKDFDAVVFLAGLSNDPMAEYSPFLNFVMNSAAVAYLAYLSKKAGVRHFVYAGSCSVYGFTDEEVSTEESVPKSEHPYGISKLMGELSAMHLADDSFSVICLRQGTVSGWSPRMRFDLLVNTMYAHAKSKGVITVNNPSIWRPVLAMTDLLQVYAKAITMPGGKSGVYNVASENVSIGDVALRIQTYFKEVHGTDIRVDTKDVQDVRNYKVSTEKATRDLGIMFTGTVESILKDLDAHVPIDTEFHDSKYHNIEIFKKVFTKST